MEVPEVAVVTWLVGHLLGAAAAAQAAPFVYAFYTSSSQDFTEDL